MEPERLLDAFDWDDYERVIVLSPHLDDAALSCFGLLRALEGVVPRLVITVCCGNPAPAPRWGKESDFRKRRDADEFGSPTERRQEDIAAMKALDCEYVHLGFSDGIYRRSPSSGELIYRTSREKFVQPRIDDASHIEELFLVMRRLCKNMGRVLLVSPMAVGYHVDHAIGAHVALRLEDDEVELLFYEDFPYVHSSEYISGIEDSPRGALERISREPQMRYVTTIDPEKKADVVRHYESQIPALFDNDARLADAMASQTCDDEPCEYYWKA